MNNKVWCVCLCCFLFCWGQDSLASEIAGIRKEIEEINKEIVEVSEQKNSDLKKFETYQKRTQRYHEEIKKENDSLSAEIQKERKKNERLDRTLTSIINKSKQIKLRDEHLKNQLIAVCVSLDSLCGNLPPLLITKYQNNLQFLISELKTNNCSSVEGLFRISQIIHKLEESIMDIQISQGISPIADIKGQIYRVRVGAIFEAVVNNDGSMAAVWDKKEKSGWRVISDETLSKKLLTAIKVREGKTVPQLVSIPLSINKGMK